MRRITSFHTQYQDVKHLIMSNRLETSYLTSRIKLGGRQMIMATTTKMFLCADQKNNCNKVLR